MSKQTLQDVVLGHVLPDIGRKHFGVKQDSAAQSLAVMRMLGGRTVRTHKAFTANAVRAPQSVVKRVASGGCKSAKELKRQLEYVTREDGVKATWMNFNGIERPLYENTVKTTVPLWTSSWVGNPQRGHTDHIILSFPKGTDIDAAEDIAREWGREVFASGNFGDQWRYIAGLHQDTDHIHAHFVVDKRGIDHGQFLSISNKSDLNFGVMRELHAQISNEHGVAMNATTRLSRGIIEYAPRETEYRAAHKAGEIATTPPMSAVERMKREAAIGSFAQQYEKLGALASMVGAKDGDAFMAQISKAFHTASETLSKGVSLVSMSETNIPNTIDPATRMAEAQDRMVEAARQAWADIQDMAPGSDRTALEVQFGEHTKDMQKLSVSDPFLAEHTANADPAVDPFANAGMDKLHSLRSGLSEGGEAQRGIERVFDEVHDRLVQSFGQRSDDLALMGTNADEMAERLMIQERTIGQIEGWRAQGNTPNVDMNYSKTVLGELENGVGDNFDEDSKFAKFEAVIVEATRLGTKDQELDTAGSYVEALAELISGADRMTEEERVYLDAIPALLERDRANLSDALEQSRSDHFDLASHEGGPAHDPEASTIAVTNLVDAQQEQLGSITEKFGMSYMELERSFAEEGRRIIGDYEVPRDLEEIIAKDQLLQADIDDNLRDVPAIEAIVQRVESELTHEAFDNVRAGDVEALRDKITDPTIRKAVASEIQNEAVVSDDPSVERLSANVKDFQEMAGQTIRLDRSDDHVADLSEEHGL